MNDKLLLTCRRLFLRGFTVQVHIGIHDFELHAAQRIVLDVDLYVRIAQGHINLQETLCDDILNRLLEHTGVMAARVSTRKPDVYPDCEAVGVEAFRAKPGVL